MKNHAVEREVRFLIPTSTVNISQAANSILISDVHFLTSSIGIRIRQKIKQDSNSNELIFKFRESDYSIEYNFPIPDKISKELFEHSSSHGLPQITKTRYLFNTPEGLTWEVDVFHGQLDFLIIAELEYEDITPTSVIMQKPSWYMGENWGCPEMEVTNDWQFLNKIIYSNEQELDAFKQEVFARNKQILNQSQ